MRRQVAFSVVMTVVLLAPFTASVSAVAPATPSFERTWARTDMPVSAGEVSRTWMWGPEASTEAMTEPYAEAPGGERTVQYYDKSRMENNDWRNASAPWDVTNGLLVVELITGRMQLGDAEFENRSPADVNVAGDSDDPTGPTYATFSSVLDQPPLASGTTITQRIARDGTFTDDPALAEQAISVAVVDDVTNHSIAAPFWTFMGSEGLIYADGQYATDALFESRYFATGRPIVEPFWANVKVAGTYRDVLMQCFERRCLTYNPLNEPGWQVEAGNVGQHYYTWRYSRGESFSYEIDDSLSTPGDELPGLSGGPARSIGTMVDGEGNRDDFALNEVMMAFRDQGELDAFLDRYNGTVLRSGMSMPIEGVTPPDYEPQSNGLYLIQIDPEQSSLNDLASNMTEAGFSGQFTFSSEDAARLIALLARERTLPIAPNIVLRGGDVPEHPQTGGGNLDAETWPWMTEDDDANMPGDQGLSVGVKRAWDYLAYKDVPPSFGSEGGSAEWTPAYVAIIDGGFDLDPSTGVPANGNQDYSYTGDKPIQVDMVDRDGSAGGRNRTSCSGGSSCPWHGQGSFGVMGAQPRNQFGSAGSGGPVVRPILMRVDWTWYGAVQGMYAVGDAIRSSQFFGSGSNRAGVISLSLSGACYTACGVTEFGGGFDDFHDYMQRAVVTATSLGGTIVAAAGNRSLNLNTTGSATGWSDTIPCELNHVICVGAIERDMQAKDYSNFGNNVDIWAPTDLLSTTSPASIAADSNDTCDPANENNACDELYMFGGTSSATPFVSGIVALMMALDKNGAGNEILPPSGTGRVAEVQRILQDTANSSQDAKVSTGYVDAYRAVTEIRDNQAPSVSVVQPANGASTSWKSSSSYFQIEVNDPEPGADLPLFLGETEVTVASDLDGPLCSVTSGYVGQTLYLCDRPQMSLGDHQLTVTATDPFGATATASLAITVTNQAPSANIDLPVNGSTYFADQTIQFSGSGFDSDEPLADSQLAWTSSIDGDLGTGREITAMLSQGEHTITLTATDSFQATGQDSVELTIQAGAGIPSALILQPQSDATIGPDQPVVLEGRGIDPEDGELPGSSMTWNSDQDGLLGTGNMLEVTLSGSSDPCDIYVDHLITLEVMDSDGNTGSQTIPVTVRRIC